MAEYVYPPVVRLCLAAFRLFDLRLEVIGGEHVPQTGGAVLASNHVGYLDFIFAGLGTHESGRLVRFMAKDAVFRHKVAGPLMRGMHHIPVDRSAGAASYAHAVEVLREGEIVGVFPEATISRSFELKEFKTGAVRMARDADVPVLPLVLWGTQRLLTKGRSPKGMKRRHLPVTIVIGEPFRPGPDADPLAATAELKERMQGLLETARDRYPGRPWPGEEPWWLPRSLGGTAPTPQEAAAKDAAAKQERSGSSPPPEPDALPPA